MTTDAATSTTATPTASPSPAPPRRRRRFGLSLQSRLLIMLLAVSLLSAVIVGAVGFVNGRESLRAAAVDQLTTIRELRTGEVQNMMAQMQLSARLDSRNLSAQEASVAFNAAFADLQNRQLSPEQTAALEAYHADTFLPKLEQGTGEQFTPSAFVPASNAGRWLQYHFTAQFADDDTALKTNDGKDGTAFSAAAQRYGSYLTGLASDVGYEDLLMMNLDGDVVYSAYKGVDLGTNLDNGPFRDSALAGAYREVIASNSVSAFRTTDFEPWVAAYGAPTMFVVSPIGDDDGITGVLAVEIPAYKINQIMTGDGGWADQGLGKTGEVYLAGPDSLMRSTSRTLVEDPDAFVSGVVANGTPRATAEESVARADTVLVQPVDTESVRRAQQGETGTTESQDYIGGQSLTAFSPVQIEGLSWVAVARIDESEAFAPVADFTRSIVLWTLGILLVVSVASLLMAQALAAPLRRLVEAVRRVAAGDLAVQVPPTGTRDEFGDLTYAFNDMASSLRLKQELIDDQRAENERLLLTLMPENVARRYREGEETIAEEHDDVAVVFGHVTGFDAYSERLSSDEETAQLNVLMRSFDEAADQAGVERVRTLRGGYLASSGLIVPRVDNARRAVDFALRMREAIERFNVQHGAALDLRAGVDTGTVTSALVARTSLAYDMWGDAVSLAYRVGSSASEPGIYVTQEVKERLDETMAFAPSDTIELRGRTRTIWRVA